MGGAGVCGEVWRGGAGGKWNKEEEEGEGKGVRWQGEG